MGYVCEMQEYAAWNRPSLWASKRRTEEDVPAKSTVDTTSGVVSYLVWVELLNCVPHKACTKAGDLTWNGVFAAVTSEMRTLLRFDDGLPRR